MVLIRHTRRCALPMVPGAAEHADPKFIPSGGVAYLFRRMCSSYADDAILEDVVKSTDIDMGVDNGVWHGEWLVFR